MVLGIELSGTPVVDAVYINLVQTLVRQNGQSPRVIAADRRSIQKRSARNTRRAKRPLACAPGGEWHNAAVY